jgi:hypothetical protein
MRKLAAVAICLFAMLFGFVAGFFVTGKHAEHLVNARAPRDGQAGLEIFANAINGGTVGAIVAFSIAIYCCGRWLKRETASAASASHT